MSLTLIIRYISTFYKVALSGHGFPDANDTQQIIIRNRKIELVRLHLLQYVWAYVDLYIQMNMFWNVSLAWIALYNMNLPEIVFYKMPSRYDTLIVTLVSIN